MKVVVANDHGATALAKKIVNHLKERGFEVNYLGTDMEDSVDYPDYAYKACSEYLKGGYEFGVLCCGTGIGISMAANKMHGIFCALPQNSYAAEKTKEHNHSNFIAFGGRIDYPENPLHILDAYIDAVPLQDEKYLRRIKKTVEIEETQKLG